MTDHDAAIRAHIHQLLDAYACTHLTDDYRSWTVDAINQVIPDILVQLPLMDISDPFTVQLPEDHFDALQRAFKLNNVKPYDERFSIPEDAVSILKEFQGSLKAIGTVDLQTSRVWYKEEPDYTPSYALLEPIISRRAVRATPKIGSGGPRGEFGRRLQQVKINKPVPCENIQDPSVSQDEALNLRLSFSEEEANESIALIKIVIGLSQSDGISPSMQAFSTQDTDERKLAELAFEPIFPRDLYPGQSTSRSSVTLRLELDLSKLENEDPDGEEHMLHLKAIDGWETVYIPSSPSPVSSQEEDQLVDFFVQSSPDTDLTLVDTPLDEVVFPKGRRLGDPEPKPELVGQGKTLDAFLAPLICMVQGIEEGQLCDDPISLNTLPHLGQGAYGSDVDQEIANIYADIKAPHDPILSEPLDLKDTLLMDLPDMSSPAGNGKLLQTLEELVAPSKDRLSSTGSLKKLRTQALNVELLWTPFRDQVPDVEDILDPASSLSLIRGIDASKTISSLLESLTFDNTDHSFAMDIWTAYNGASTTDVETGILHCEIILTRCERLRLSGDVINAAYNMLDERQPPLPFQRINQNSSYMTPPRPSKRRRITDNSDDSSVGQPLDDKYDLEYFLPDSSEDVSASIHPNDPSPFHNPDIPMILQDHSFTPRFPFENSRRELQCPLPSTIISVSQASPIPRMQPVAPTTSPLNTFLRVRSRLSLASKAPSPPPPEEETVQSEDPSILHEVPDEIYNAQTLQLPTELEQPSSVHRYLASIQILQKSAYIRLLRSPSCAIELVDRETLGGVSIIVDPHSSILVVSLFSLPSTCEDLCKSICTESWRYSNILIIFEAYAESRSFHSRRSNEPHLNAFTPPIIKSLKTFRRLIDIAEGCENKRLQTRIWYAFARSVEEAAFFTRLYGNFIESSEETHGMLWDNRSWLQVEPQEAEDELAVCVGMNAFAACVILYQHDLQTFLDMSADERLDASGELIGVERMMRLSSLIDERTRELEQAESFD